jgi:hypothetical protein
MPDEEKHTLTETLFTDADVARVTGRARKTLQKDRLHGGAACIPFIRIGRLVRYRQSDVAAFIAARPTLHSTSDPGDCAVLTARNARPGARPDSAHRTTCRGREI